MTSDLITRLSKLDAPDREMDGEIWRYLMSGEPRAVLHGPIPKLTASVDAAIALAARVLPGWNWLRPERNIMAVHHEDHSITFFAVGATPAIALLIALLRAKEASKL